MERLPQKKFTSPDEEIAFLREVIAQRDREQLASVGESFDRTSSTREILV